MSKVDRAKNGPGWGEVILGAVLSLVLGVAIGAVLLILKPVVPAKEQPKEATAGTVYYIEGRRGGAAEAQQAMAKERALVSGQSVRVSEEELTALAATPNKGQPPAGVAGAPGGRGRGGGM